MLAILNAARAGHVALRAGGAWRALATTAREGPITAEEFAAAMERVSPSPPVAAAKGRESVVAAVSGGADSMALLALLVQWRATHEPSTRIVAATVDHKLRDGSSDEAARVAKWIGALDGVDEHVMLPLSWREGVPESGVPKRARDGRYARLLAMCQRAGSTRLCTAHQSSDQAETFVARVAHSSGVVGLASMRPVVPLRQGVQLLRPLLDFPRARLEATCAALGVPYVEDPTNADQRFQRPRIRLALAELDASGALPASLTDEMVAVAQRARDDVERDVESALGRVFHLNQRFLYGYVSSDALLAENEYTGRRVLSHIVQCLGGSETPPRLHALHRLHWNMTQPNGNTTSHTLGHTLFHPQPKRKQWLALRELGSKHNRTTPWAPGTALWDGRYRIRLQPHRRGNTGGVEELGEQLHVRQLTAEDLTESLRYVAPWVPKRVLFTLPVLEDEHGLVAIPHLQVFLRRGWFVRADVAPRTPLLPSEPHTLVQE